MSAALPVADERADRDGWLAARRTGVTATEVAKLHNGGAAARKALLDEKLHGSSFTGNAYTEHGKAREPYIADWVARKFKIQSTGWLFAHPDNPRHLASPDGVHEQFDFDAALAEIKTTKKSLETIPPQYFDQMQWQMYVMQAEHVLFVWEEHEDFVPIALEPRFQWVKRDEQTISELRAVADEFLALMDGAEEQIDPRIDELAAQYLSAMEVESSGKASKDDAGKKIRKLIGDNPSFKQVGRYGMVTRTISRVTTEEVTLTVFDVDQFKSDFPDLYASYQTTTTKTVTSGGRETLRVTAHKAKEKGNDE